MHRTLEAQQIREVARQLLAHRPATSGRAVRAELRRRFGHAGRTERVFAIWREMRAQMLGTTLNAGTERERLESQLRAARGECAALQARAERAEAREVAHQDRWAREVHELRQQVQQLSGEGRARAALEGRCLDLQREVAVLRARLAQYE